MIQPIGRMISAAEDKKDHLRVIGLITVNFAMLENTLAGNINILLGVEQRISQMITSEQSFTGMLKLFDSLLQDKISDEKIIGELKSLVVRLGDTQQKRNIITHSTWAAGSTSDYLTRFKTSTKIHKGLKHQFQQTSVADLQVIADDISVLAGDLTMFIYKLKGII